MGILEVRIGAFSSVDRRGPPVVNARSDGALGDDLANFVAELAVSSAQISGMDRRLVFGIALYSFRGTRMRRGLRAHVSATLYSVSFAFLVACTSGGADAQSQARIAGPEKPATINPFLFEVRKNDRISWIFGTIHFGIPYAEVAAFVEPRLQGARAVYFEIGDIDYIRKSISDPLNTMLTSDFDFNSGPALTQAMRERLIRDYKIPPKIADVMHGGSCGAFEYAFNLGQPDMDGEMLLAADRLRKPIFGLDVHNLRAEAESPAIAQNAYQCSIEDTFLTDTRAELEAFWQSKFTRYRTGIDYVKKFENRSVEFRNRVWMSRLNSEFARGDVFVAVGVGHLYGNGNLLQLLRAAGFSVTRIR